MTGAAGDTTTTDSRSRRNRASRRGGQLQTRALGSSYVSACPHFVLPVPLSRWSHHTPRCRTPQQNIGTEKSHTGYKRHGTLSLLAGIDLLTGKVHALVRDRHRSREFIEFLKCLDAAYPASTAIKLILDNHSAHISRETTAWLDARPPGRFEFTFTPKHGSWLNLIEGFFSKFARSVLRHIRVTSKHELKERIMAGIDDVNRHPVIHTWSYKLADAA